MTPDEQKLPMRATMQVIRRLQEVIAPQVFTPRAVYDGRKNMFAVRELPFTGGTQTVKSDSAMWYCLFTRHIH